MSEKKSLEEVNNLQIIEPIAKTIFSSEIISTGAEIIDESIDSLINLKVLENIPIIKTIYSLSKGFLAIREKFFLKKLLVFMDNFNKGNAKQEEIDKRRKAVENNEDWIMKEVELLTIHLDRIDELEKSKIASAFYAEYINGNISFNEYREYLAIIERVFFQDFIQIIEFYESELEFKKIKENMQNKLIEGGMSITSIDHLNCHRLIAVGLIGVKEKVKLTGDIRKEYLLTNLGFKFAEMLHKEILVMENK